MGAKVGYLLIIATFILVFLPQSVLSDCTGSDVSPCDCCDVNGMWVNVTAPSGGGSTGQLSMTYNTSSGTCGTTPWTNETWNYSLGYTFCPTEGQYTAIATASSAGGDQACSSYSSETSTSLNIYVVGWDDDENWCDCKMTTTGCGGLSCWNESHQMSWEAGTSQGCCGDDGEETYRYFMSYNIGGIYDNETCDDVNDEYCVNGGRNASDKACCDDNEDCVAQGTCYTQNIFADVDEDGRTDGWCVTSDAWNGSWRDCDNSQINCNGGCGANYVIGGEGSQFGEYDSGSATECCGDDPTEEYAYRIADASMDNSWATNASDEVCCDNANDCGTSNTCYTSGDVSTDVDGDGDNDYCNTGTWYDCNTNIQCTGGDDCISGDCVDAIDLTYVYPTPEHDSRQPGTSVTINVTANDTNDNDIDTCWLEWNDVNETMTKVGSGTYVTCFSVKSVTSGVQYTFRVYANDTTGADELENERNFTANVPPDLAGINLNVSYAKSGDFVLVTSSGANDTDGDSYNMRCGNQSGLENLCNSTQGTGERICTFASPWSDDINHTVYCHLDDTYDDSAIRSLNITADNSPPTPNPAQISSILLTSTSATITAATASDSGAGLHSLPYRFNDSGSWINWQAGNTYVNSSLVPNTYYCFRVQYRDNLSNIGSASTESCNYTSAQQPSITNVTCYHNGTHYCEVNFSMGSNPSGTEYFIDETTGNSGGDDRGWTSWSGEDSYTDEVSLPHTQYCYRIMARNQDSIETFYSSTTCSNSYNNIPVVQTAIVYDASMTEITAAKAGSRIYIRSNVTDGDGSSDLLIAKISIKDNESVTVLGETNMTSVSSITNGYMYQYYYTIPSSAQGTWTFEIKGIDLGNGQGTGSASLNVIVLRLEIKLILNEKLAKTYIPGTGERGFSSMANEYFSGLEDYYLASYYNNTLYGLVFQNQYALGVFTNKTTDDFALGMDLKYPNSIVFQVMSKGDWRKIQNRMKLINKGDFLDYTEPTFAFGLGEKYKIKICLDYGDKDIQGSERKIEGGNNPISIKHGGLSGENIILDVSRG